MGCNSQVTINFNLSVKSTGATENNSDNFNAESRNVNSEKSDKNNFSDFNNKSESFNIKKTNVTDESEFFLAEEAEENINDFKEKFLPSKLMTLKMSKVYSFLKDYSKSANVYVCGSYLEFELLRGKTIDKKKLRRLNSCKLRLCPFCAWRRSLRIFSNVKSCYDYIVMHEKKKSNFKSRFLFLTLTTKNCALSELKSEVDLLLKGFDVLKRYQAFKNAYMGFIRALEVVVDREKYITKKMYFVKKQYYDKINLKIGDLNNNYLKCNVHVHVLLHTTYQQYQKYYLSQNELTALWKKACKLDYNPIVHIRSFKARNKNQKGRELAELTKYTVKFNDYLKANYDDFKGSSDHEFVLDAQIIASLDYAFFKRRLFAYGGTFKEAHKILRLNDEKMVNNSEAVEAEKMILKYYFDFVHRSYKRAVDFEK